MRYVLKYHKNPARSLPADLDKLQYSHFVVVATQTHLHMLDQLHMRPVMSLWKQRSSMNLFVLHSLTTVFLQVLFLSK